MEDSVNMLQMMMIASWSIFMKLGRIHPIHPIHQTGFIQWIVYNTNGFIGRVFWTSLVFWVVWVFWVLWALWGGGVGRSCGHMGSAHCSAIAINHPCTNNHKILQTWLKRQKYGQLTYFWARYEILNVLSKKHWHRPSRLKETDSMKRN